MRGGAYLLLALLVLPIGMAATIDGIVTETGPLESVRPGADINAFVVVTIDPNTYRIALTSPDGSLKSTIGQNTVVYNPQLESCTTCRIPVVLRGAQQITVQMTDIHTDRTQHDTETTYQFLVDNQPPMVTATINGCDAVCAHNGELKLELTIEDNSGVGTPTIQVGGQTVTADCQAVSQRQLQCTYEQTVSTQTSVYILASDGAGNTREVTRQIEYDANPPRIERVRFDGAPAGTAAFGGQQVTIVVDVTEERNAVARYVSPTIDEQGQCESVDGRKVCRILIPQLPNYNYEESGVVVVTDSAGNEDTQEFTFEVLETDTQTEPDFWTVTGGSTQPLNIHVARLLPVDIHTQLTFASSSNNAQVHSIEGECDVAGNVWGHREDFVAHIPQSRTLTIPLTIYMHPASQYSTNGDSPLFNEPITCDLQIRTRIGSSVFQRTEHEQVEIAIDWTSKPPPEQTLIEQRLAAEQRLQESRDSIQSLTSTVDTLGLMCGTTRQLSDLQHALGVVAQATYAIPGIGQAAGQIPHQGRNSVERVNSGWQSFSNKLCVLVSCEQSALQAVAGVDWTNNVASQFGFGEDGKISSALQQWSGTDDLSSLYNPRRSLYAAQAYGCLPAVLHHMERKHVIECEYDACVQTMDATDRTLQECALDRDYMECRLTKSWEWHALPHANILSSVKDRIDSTLANPLGLLGLAQAKLCQGTGQPQLWCQLPEDLYGVSQAANLINGFEDIRNAYANFQPRDVCGSVESRYEALDNPLYKIKYPDVDWCTGGLCQKTLDDGTIYISDGRSLWKADDSGTGSNPQNTQQLAIAGYTLEQQQIITQDMRQLQNEIAAQQSLIDKHITDGNQGQANVAREKRDALQSEFNQLLSSEGFQNAASIQSLLEAAEYQQSMYDLGQLLKTLPEPGTVLHGVSQRVDSITQQITQIDKEIEEQNKLLEDALRQDTEDNPDCEVGQECYLQQYVQSVNAQLLVSGRQTIRADLERQLQEQAEIARVELLREQYRQYPVATAIHSMQVFSNIGEALRVLPQGKATNWMHSTWDFWDDTIGEFLDYTDPEERYIANRCSSEQPAENEVHNAHTGGLSLRISAVSQPREGETVYAVSVYAAIPDLRQTDTFRVELRGAGDTLVTNPIDGTQRFLLTRTQLTGQQAIIETHTARYTEACILLDRELREYLDVDHTDDDARKICTQVIEVNA